MMQETKNIILALIIFNFHHISFKMYNVINFLFSNYRVLKNIIKYIKIVLIKKNKMVM